MCVKLAIFGARVEVARPNWAHIRQFLSGHMFSVRSNYMIWKNLWASFCLDNGLELVWAEKTTVWSEVVASTH